MITSQEQLQLVFGWPNWNLSSTVYPGTLLQFKN